MNFWGPNMQAVLEWAEKAHPEWGVGALTPYQLCDKMNEALGMNVRNSTEIEAGAAMWLEALKRQS